MNFEMEQKIVKKSDEYTYKGSVVNFLLLLLNSLEDLKKEEELSFELDPDIEELRTDIKNMILTIEESLDSAVKRRESLNECYKIKERLLEIYKGIYGYFSTWKISSSRIADEITLRRYFNESDESKNVNFAYLYQMVENFINTAPNLSIQKRYMGQILAVLPYKGSDEEYFSFVKKCLKFAFKDQPEDLINKSLETFMELYAPDLIENYGRYFPGLADWLEQTKEYAPSTLTTEMLNEAQNAFEEKFEKLSEIENVFSNLLNDVNALIGLFYIGYEFNEITLNEFRIKDAYLSICELIKNEATPDEVEAMEDSIREILEDTVDELLSELNVVISQQAEYMSNIKNFEDLSEETQIVLNNQNFIRALRLEDINNEIFSILTAANGAPADRAFINEKTDEFILKLDNYFKTLPPQYKHVVMREFFNSIPPVYTVKNVIDKLHNALESCNNINEKLLIVDRIGLVFNENHFGEKKENA